MSQKPISSIQALSDQAIDLVLRLHSGTATDADRLQAAQFQQRSPSHRKAFQEAERLWLDMGHALQQADSLSNRNVIPTIANANRFGWITHSLAAAIVLIAVILPFTRYPDDWLSDYHTAIGKQQTVTLADGSQILLNTGTAISVDYQPTGRKIRLRHGQALFTVAADRNRPFEVTAGDAVVKALGTVFEVNTKANGIEITVQEHAVGIKSQDDKAYPPAARIEAGQHANYSADQGLGDITSVDLAQTSGWQRGKLIFKNQPFQSVVAELNRYYPGQIVLVSRHLAALRVTGVFPANDTAAALAMIEHILPVKVRRVTPWLTLLGG